MSQNYKFYNFTGVYFVSFAVKEWIAVFTPRCKRARGIIDHRLKIGGGREKSKIQQTVTNSTLAIHSNGLPL